MRTLKTLALVAAIGAALVVTASARNSHLDMQMPKPSPKSTLGPRTTPTSGNGCGGLGAVAIDEIEKVATVAAGDEKTFVSLLDHRMEELRIQYEGSNSPYNMRDLFMPDWIWKKLDAQTLRTCVPNFVRHIETIRDRKEELKKQARAAEAERHTPHGRLMEGYKLFYLARYCNEVRRGYVVQYVNDDELDRATTVIRAIVTKAKTDDPGINTDAVWDESAKLINHAWINIEACHGYLHDLFVMSPVAIYDTNKPADPIDGSQFIFPSK